MWLIRALTILEGLPGLRDGLSLLRGSLERHWDGLYPPLNPGPESRFSVLDYLGHPGALVGDVREAPLVEASGFGAFGLRAIKAAEENIVGAPDPAQITAAFRKARDQNLDELRAMATTIEEARTELAAIRALLQSARGATGASPPKLDGLTNALDAIRGIYRDQRVIEAGPPATAGSPLPDGGAAVLGQDDGAAPANGPAAGPPRPAPPSSSRPAAPTAVNGREDVVRMIDAILAYYDRVEPSSPVPLLLTRAKGLVFKTFVEAIQDLVPSGLAEIQKLGGLEAEEARGRSAKR